MSHPARRRRRLSAVGWAVVSLVGGGSGLARSAEAGVSREDRQGEEGAGGRRRAASGSQELVVAAFRLPPWAWVTCAQSPPCPTGCPLGALQISCRPRWSSPKLSFSFFSPPAPYPDRPCPVSRHALPLPLSPLWPTLMPLPAPKTPLWLCAPCAPSNLDPSLHPNMGGCSSVHLTLGPKGLF